MAWDLWRAPENDRTISDSRRRCRASLPIRSPLQRGSACRRSCGPMDPGEVDPAQPLALPTEGADSCWRVPSWPIYYSFNFAEVASHPKPSQLEQMSESRLETPNLSQK